MVHYGFMIGSRNRNVEYNQRFKTDVMIDFDAINSGFLANMLLYHCLLFFNK